MKRITPMLVVAVLTACGPSEAPKQANVPTVEELAADPARLKELRQQCKIDRATLGEVLCNQWPKPHANDSMAMERRPTHHRKHHRSSDYQSVAKTVLLCQHAAVRPRLRRFYWVLHSLKRCFFIILLPITVFDRH